MVSPGSAVVGTRVIVMAPHGVTRAPCVPGSASRTNSWWSISLL